MHQLVDLCHKYKEQILQLETLMMSQEKEHQETMEGTAKKFLNNIKLLEGMQVKMEEYDVQISRLSVQNAELEVQCIKMEEENKM